MDATQVRLAILGTAIECSEGVLAFTGLQNWVHNIPFIVQMAEVQDYFHGIRAQTKEPT